MTVVRLRGANNFGSNTSISCTLAGNEVDDLLIATVFVNQNGSGNLPITDPSGWTLLADLDVASTVHLKTYWKKVASAGTTSLTITGWGVSRVVGLFIDEYFGQNLTTPFTSNATSSGTSTQAVSASITPDATDDLYCAIGNLGGTTLQTDTPGAWTQRQTGSQGAGTNNGMTFGTYDIMDPGATPTSLTENLKQAGVLTSRAWGAIIARIDDRGAVPPSVDVTFTDTALWSNRFMGFDQIAASGAAPALSRRGMTGVGA